MTGVVFDPPPADEEWRRRIYDGEIIILSPTPDFAPIPEEIVAGYDEGVPVDGVTIFKPERRGSPAS